MSEVEKALTDAYYWLSMYKSGTVPEGLAMEKVKEAIFEQPTLNENQQIVLDYLKRQAPTGKPLQVIFWLMNTVAWDKLDELRNPIMHLTNKEQAQVLQAFATWVEQEEE